MNNLSGQLEKAKAFHQLHFEDKPLILPNVWDELGAMLLSEMAYKTVATSSSAVAQSQGYPDGEKLPFELLLNRLRSIVQAVNIPVSADVESAYARTDSELVKNINLLLDTGIVGINYEDSDKISGELVPAQEQADKISLIRETAEKRGIPLFINARIDTYVHADHLNFEQKLAETIQRAELYNQAGANCVFPILMTDEKQIRSLVSSVDLPVNIMVYKGIPDLKTLAEIGVRRISIGGAYLKYALQAMKNLAAKLQDLDGLDDIFSVEINSDAINKIIGQRKFT